MFIFFYIFTYIYIYIYIYIDIYVIIISFNTIDTRNTHTTVALKNLSATSVFPITIGILADPAYFHGVPILARYTVRPVDKLHPRPLELVVPVSHACAMVEWRVIHGGLMFRIDAMVSLYYDNI